MSAAITSLSTGSSCGSFDEGHVQVVKYYLNASKLYIMEEDREDVWQKQVRWCTIVLRGKSVAPLCALLCVIASDGRIRIMYFFY